MVHVVPVDCTCFRSSTQTLRCHPTARPHCQVLLYMLYKGSPDIEMWFYCWSMLSCSTHYVLYNSPQTWRCCPTDGPRCSVWLYMLLRDHQTLRSVCTVGQPCQYMLYKQSPDIEMRSYWWSILSCLTVHIIQGVPRHWDNYGPTGGPWSQVLLYVLYKGSPDIEMSSYWWSIISDLTVCAI